MIELIFIIILILGLIGMSVILLRKMQILNKLPEPAGGLQQFLGLKIKEGVKKFPGTRDFSYEVYLQKILSKIRVFTLKTDHKTSGWLERLRQKNNQKNHSGNDKYWDELKKAKDGK